ncbi:GlsB/YeaQ/YmgE family stress response membrane protein [Glutamicibacter ardleyensis]|uniref:GlsB/YeaQ/YmgE family stress response membrane protein n=1 Tax=Glutamicibacter ardleyensis TaxID=225894 RepID=UPI003FCF87DB
MFAEGTASLTSFSGHHAKNRRAGKQGGGWIATLVLGVVGAVVGGWIGSALFNADISSFWSLSTWLLAIGGSLIVLIIWGFLTRKKA